MIHMAKPMMIARTAENTGLSQIVRGPLGAAPFSPGARGLFGFGMVHCASLAQQLLQRRDIGLLVLGGGNDLLLQKVEEVLAVQAGG